MLNWTVAVFINPVMKRHAGTQQRIPILNVTVGGESRLELKYSTLRHEMAAILECAEPRLVIYSMHYSFTPSDFHDTVSTFHADMHGVADIKGIQGMRRTLLRSVLFSGRGRRVLLVTLGADNNIVSLIMAMKRNLYAAYALLLGLVTAHCIATLEVYLSNVGLHRSLTAIRAHGFLAIPNELIMDRLLEFGPAFWGGLFFTLSVGAGLSVISLVAAWLWDRIFQRRRLIAVIYTVLWVVILILANLHGFCPFVTMYFSMIPVVVFMAALKWMPAEQRDRLWLSRAVRLLPVVILAIVWTGLMTAHMFVDIRDNILLSNRLGIRVNDFYYRYTLYPAEVFKTLEQKMLKTCSLSSDTAGSPVQKLRATLRAFDYLDVGEMQNVDLRIRQEGRTLHFISRGTLVFDTTAENFFARPQYMLAKFSSSCDRYAFFRLFTVYSIVIGFPIVLYILLYALIFSMAHLWMRERTASTSASILCLFIGLAFVVPIYPARGDTRVVDDIPRAVESTYCRDRIKALKIMYREKMEIAEYRMYKTMISSSCIAERYWLARTLGVSRHCATYNDLLRLLDDPQVNVVCKAYEALGRRADQRGIAEITRRIERIDHWYVQWYAYRALRSLGWMQTGLN